MESSVTAPTLWGLIEARAAATPDAVMLIDERDRTMTFAEYRDACERAAAGLFAQGVRGGDTISWQIPTWIETLVLMAALSRLGVRQVPLLPIYRERELTFCLRQAGAKTLYVPGTWRGFDYVALAERVRERIGQFDIVVLDHVLPDGDPALLPPPPPAEDAHVVRWVYYTSGTTSDPKGAQHTDHTSISSGIAFNDAQGPRPDDRYGVAFPFTHVGGLGNLCAVLNAGFSLVITEFFDPPVSVELFRRHGCTMVGGGPIFFKIFLDEQRKQPGTPILPKLRFMTGGGAPMPPGVALRGQARDGRHGMRQWLGHDRELHHRHQRSERHRRTHRGDVGQADPVGRGARRVGRWQRRAGRGRRRAAHSGRTSLQGLPRPCAQRDRVRCRRMVLHGRCRPSRLATATSW